VLSQSHARALLDVGAPFLDFCEARNLPLLFHANPVGDEYSHPDDIFAVVESRPHLRFCFAHCLLFHRAFLDRAAVTPNAWVDTAALKIQVEMVNRLTGTLIQRADLIEPDLADYRDVFAYLADTYPTTMLWGSDAPAYAYICNRQNATGVWMEFRLKGTYEDEVAGLRSLPPEAQARVSNRNTLDFLFGVNRT
jgi:predicted TIM-barrel fold metal-dependent hydrolase